MSTATIEDISVIPQTQEPEVKHIILSDGTQSASAMVLAARVNGTPLEALCGVVFVPHRDPSGLPLCQKCKEIYDLDRAFNPNLPEEPAA